MITYDPLTKTLQKRNKSIYSLVKDKIIGGGTLNRIRANQSVSLDTINQICNYLHCKITDVILYTPDDK